MTRQANELPLRKLKKSRKIKNVVNFYFFESEKKFTTPANEFQLHRYSKKNVQIQLISLCYTGTVKKCTNPANEFLLHKCRNNIKTEKYIFFSNLKKCTSLF